MRLFNRSRKSLAQTTVEYAIIIALIAVAAIGAYMALGSSNVKLLEHNVDRLEGGDSERVGHDVGDFKNPSLGDGGGM